MEINYPGIIGMLSVKFTTMRGKGTPCGKRRTPPPPKNMPVTFPLMNVIVPKLIQLGAKANRSRHRCNDSMYKV